MSDNVTIEYTPSEFECEEKRFYLPGLVIKATCPECGDEMSRDYESDYFSYPKLNGVTEVTLYCGTSLDDGSDCNAELEVKVKLGVTVQLEKGS